MNGSERIELKAARKLDEIWSLQTVFEKGYWEEHNVKRNQNAKTNRIKKNYSKRTIHSNEIKKISEVN